MIKQYEKFLPAFLQDLVNKGLYKEVIEISYKYLEDFISDEFKQEVQGLSDGCGLPFMDVMGVNIFPELIQAQCSIVGTWGDAIKQVGGSLYQVRALDWNTNGPFQQWPLFIVYHPEQSNGHSFGILTWPLLVGAMTGYSSSHVGICEKVWFAYNGFKSREGTPWTQVLRDILQYDNSVTEGLNRLIAAHRTCSIWVGLGHTETSRTQFNIVAYSYQQINVYDDMNFQVNNSAHPQIKDIVYVDKHVQPSGNPCLGELLKNNYGKLNAPNIIQNVTPIIQTGDMHLAVYDFLQNLVYVSNASPWVNNTCTPAYDRPFVRLNMTELFGQTN